MVEKTAYTVDERLAVTESNFKTKVNWIIGAIERTVGLSNPKVSFGKSTVNKGIHKKLYGKSTTTAQSWISEVLEAEPILAKKKVSVVTVEYQEFSLIGTVFFRPDPRRRLGVSFDTGFVFKIKVGRKFYPFSHFSSMEIEKHLKKALPSLNEKAQAQNFLKNIGKIRGVTVIEDNEDGTYLIEWKDSRRGGDFDEYRDRYMYDYGYDEDQASEMAHDEYYESIEAQKQSLLTAIYDKGALVVDYDVSLYRSIAVIIKMKGEKMSNLRNKIIRLAHSKPELRKHLLPLLKESSKLRDLGKGKYQYGTFQFEIEDGELNMTKPDYYEGGIDALGDAPKLDDIITVIVDYYDFENRDFNKYPIDKDEIKQIKKNFSFREIQKFFGLSKEHLHLFK